MKTLSASTSIWLIIVAFSFTYGVGLSLGAYRGLTLIPAIIVSIGIAITSAVLEGGWI